VHFHITTGSNEAHSPASHSRSRRLRRWGGCWVSCNKSQDKADGHVQNKADLLAWHHPILTQPPSVADEDQNKSPLRSKPNFQKLAVAESNSQQIEDSFNRSLTTSKTLPWRSRCRGRKSPRKNYHNTRNHTNFSVNFWHNARSHTNSTCTLQAP